uniref:Uncharacterized protein n=1 Tax=Romanomermis culicivorax TaxID=13658 RepID=A0A915IZL5_ROMCU
MQQSGQFAAKFSHVDNDGLLRHPFWKIDFYGLGFFPRLVEEPGRTTKLLLTTTFGLNSNSTVEFFGNQDPMSSEASKLISCLIRSQTIASDAKINKRDLFEALTSSITCFNAFHFEGISFERFLHTSKNFSAVGQWGNLILITNYETESYLLLKMSTFFANDFPSSISRLLKNCFKRLMSFNSRLNFRGT